ncbi:MAG: four helix bundle protein [Muribaculaceae bacterium]|nr:four helix bundle protein [Muribaculaceae bacterium]
MRDFKKLQIWQKAHQLTLAIYKTSQNFPIDERFGLTSQLRRAAISIPSNIAEGCGRNTVGELAQFIQIAIGSSSEVEYQLLLAHDLGLISDEIYVQLKNDLSEMIRMMISYNDKIRNHKNKNESDNKTS